MPSSCQICSTASRRMTVLDGPLLLHGPTVRIFPLGCLFIETHHDDSGCSAARWKSQASALTRFWKLNFLRSGRSPQLGQSLYKCIQAFRPKVDTQKSILASLCFGSGFEPIEVPPICQLKSFRATGFAHQGRDPRILTYQLCCASSASVL